MSSPLAFVIEDDKNLSFAYAEAVESAGFQVEIFRDGTEGLENLKKTVPALIILDLNLPGVNGVEILKYVRSDNRLEKTRVLVATADDRTAELLHGNADIVLVKPIGFGQLRDLAARLLPKIEVN
ncbi:MAG TPA: response regulator [Anaerolineales bacterium]|nr:response regulator [Anaerolineales bacterium]